LRISGYADFALVGDTGRARHVKGYPGVGSGLESPLPFGILLSVEWGYGVAGRDSNGNRGTHVVRVTSLKMF
jgi:hypothetical protein